MRIGELARRVGLTTETIRFYEKRGLLGDTACDRTESNYRVYTETAVERLETITAAKTLGFSLTEILELSRLWDSGQLSPEMRAEVLRGKLAELDDKKQSIERLQALIERKLSALGPSRGDALVDGDGEVPAKVRRARPPVP
jgi:DNA-binding transcriptional MerR regulator